MMSLNNLLLRPLSIFVASIFILSACSEDSSPSTDRDANSEASYKVTFNTNWNDTDFPTNFPGGAHFSGLIGGTHNDQVKFWEVGQIASDGIESMAETGAQSTLASEVEAAKTDGKAQFVLSGAGATAVDSVELEFDINQAYPLVTLASMVAPSPDWFVGVRDLSLFDNNAGDWHQTVTVQLAVYDAGSDSGAVFISGNADTQPPEIIMLLTSVNTDTDFVLGRSPADQVVATMTFTRIK